MNPSSLCSALQTRSRPQLASATYLTWRALRSLTPGWAYFYSIPFWLMEALGWFMSNIFILGLWEQVIQRLVRSWIIGD